MGKNLDKMSINELRIYMAGLAAEGEHTEVGIIRAYTKRRMALNTCPDCGKQALMMEGRCITCRDCGWSKCG